MFGKRLNQLFDEMKLKNMAKNRKEMCELLGIDYSSLAKYVDGRIGFSAKPENFEKCRKVGVNLDWLMTGKGSPFLDEPKEQSTAEAVEYEFPVAEGTQLWLEFGKAVEKVMEPKIDELASRTAELDKRTDDLARRIARLESRAVGGADEVREPEVEYGVRTVELPLAENLAAGLPREAFESGETFFVPENYLSAGARYCVARISGDSMTQLGIYDGSYVLLRYSDQAVAGKVCVVRYGDETTLKKLENTKEGGWQLVYCDGSDTVIPLVAGDWEVLGEFVRVVR